MINKLIIYLKALKVCLITKSIKRAEFYIYEQGMDVSKYDDDMLIAQLGYFGHHTEKALKHHDRGNRGKHKRDKLELLIKEFKNREINESRVIEWAQNLVDYYDENQKIYIKHTDKISIHPQKEQILQFIKARTTTRFWQPREIDDNTVRDILETAISSALSCNRQTIRFSVVKNEIENMVIGDSNNKSMFNKAPLTIYVSDDSRFFAEKYGNSLNVGGVCSLIQLAASAYGISSTWMYYADFYDQDEIRKKLGLNDYMFVYSVISLGYPLDDQTKPPRCDVDRFIIKRKNNENR
ncbi:nitroreductase family protein [Vibrio sp. 404]|uniref:Nitroreductase family protein n=1 Tax=Vibrio marinisediminis TaxID=2758441 RepID=A0A7W2FRE5_9VIBR|nr:nitroreductase family protein [Vibrio marinisediminis]